MVHFAVSENTGSRPIVLILVRAEKRGAPKHA